MIQMSQNGQPVIAKARPTAIAVVNTNIAARLN
jgi:hypothetical protein